MQGQQYVRSQFDHCIYFKKSSNGSLIYLLLNVDDMLIASKGKIEVERIKHQLSKEFEMKESGKARKILGMEIRLDKPVGKIWLSQRAYLQKVLKKFKVDDSTKPVSTALAPHFKISAKLCPKRNEE